MDEWGGGIDPGRVGEHNEAMDIWNDMAEELARRRAAGLYRQEVILAGRSGPIVCIDGREVVNFCSNDYLGLAGDDRLAAAASDALARWGVGAGASRLVCGTSQAHVALEEKLAAFKQTASAVLCPTGWMANRAAVSVLAGPGDLILCDKLDHASILDAAAASGARVRTFHHNDLDRLDTLLTRHRAEHRRCAIIADSLFSMDGDLADLPGLVDCKARHDAVLMLDEAHATGVFGEHGRGAVEHFGLAGQVDVTVGTASKALGVLGGFVAGPAVLAETIRNAARAYIYTTAMPPMLCGAIAASLEIIAGEPSRRAHVLALADRLRSRLSQAGLDTGPSASQIVPVIVGPAERAVTLSRELLDDGFFVQAIRPPTVPRDTSRLRVSISAAHSEAQVDELADALIGRMRG
jgi:8-amino-7-oxononanoate synthase